MDSSENIEQTQIQSETVPQSAQQGTENKTSVGRESTETQTSETPANDGETPVRVLFYVRCNAECPITVGVLQKQPVRRRIRLFAGSPIESEHYNLSLTILIKFNQLNIIITKFSRSFSFD